MAVTIVFLGPLRDMAAAPIIQTDAPVDWQRLMEVAGDKVAEQLQTGRVNVACAGKVLSDKTRLLAEDGDEVALLPPVSGG